MIPVTITSRAQRAIGGDLGNLTKHREAWQAVSKDGLWVFERLEERGTPWLVTFRLCPEWHAMFTSLTRARQGAVRQFGFDLSLALIHAFGLERPSSTGKVYVQ